MNKRKIKIVCLIFVAMIILTSCVPGDGSYSISHKANILSGIWHGWIAPISLILHFLNRNIRIYETINTGFWYDLGFYLGVVGGFGSLSLFRKK